MQLVGLKHAFVSRAYYRLRHGYERQRIAAGRAICQGNGRYLAGRYNVAQLDGTSIRGPPALEVDELSFCGLKRIRLLKDLNAAGPIAAKR